MKILIYEQMNWNRSCGDRTMVPHVHMFKDIYRHTVFMNKVTAMNTTSEKP